jgi:BirA family transcriptional regulator, biotin operon repressor / biotin---[acetyl-CoA-carboxylase] ligase
MALIDPVLLKSRLGNLAGRFDVDALDECDSTSSELMRRADRGAPAGTVIVADRQSAGRGRRGRSWLSTAGDSLTFSLLWRFPGQAGQLSGLSLAIGAGLAQALEELGANGIRLKWPNDVLVESGSEFAKLAGILIELSSDRRGTQAIIGIGLNLAMPQGEFPQPVAGLVQACPTLPDRHRVLAALLAGMVQALDTFAVDGFFGLKMKWQGYHAWQGLPVRVVDDGQALLSGICLGVDDDGCLLLETDAGLERVLSGDVSLRPA